MHKIGITGGIGSGKTTVCNIFELLGIPVYYADIEAKFLMNDNKKLRKNIIRLFGTESYTFGDKLNREYIADRVFNNKDLLEELNKLVHPAVKTDFENWVKKQKSKYIIKEAALLFETGSYKDLDKIVVVTAPLEMRIDRVMNRDNTSRESILARIKNQMPEEEKVRMADYVIVNDGNTSLIMQVIELDKEFKR